MPVITLHPSLLAEACHQLSYRILATGCRPALIVGILSGGAEVARLMRRDFAGTPYAEVRISRPSTQDKETGLFHRLLQILPLWLCDLLRIVESRVAEFRSKGRLPERIGSVSLDAKVPVGGTILLVDDAIDTGATVSKLRLLLCKQYPGVDFKIAVVTVTTSHPICDADFFLYHNRTLCRFPWSNDYRS